MQAIYMDMPVRKRKYPVVLNVPVNLRKEFPSATARNFFGNAFTQYDFQNCPAELDSIIAKVAADFRSELSGARLSRTAQQPDCARTQPVPENRALAAEEFCHAPCAQFRKKERDNGAVQRRPFPVRREAQPVYRTCGRVRGHAAHAPVHLFLWGQAGHELYLHDGETTSSATSSGF